MPNSTAQSRRPISSVENLRLSAGFLVRFDQSEVLRGDLQWVDFLAKRGLTSSPRVGLHLKQSFVVNKAIETVSKAGSRADV